MKWWLKAQPTTFSTPIKMQKNSISKWCSLNNINQPKKSGGKQTVKLSSRALTFSCKGLILNRKSLKFRATQMNFTEYLNPVNVLKYLASTMSQHIHSKKHKQTEQKQHKKSLWAKKHQRHESESSTKSSGNNYRKLYTDILLIQKAKLKKFLVIPVLEMQNFNS